MGNNRKLRFGRMSVLPPLLLVFVAMSCAELPCRSPGLKCPEDLTETQAIPTRTASSGEQSSSPELRFKEESTEEGMHKSTVSQATQQLIAVADVQIDRSSRAITASITSSEAIPTHLAIDFLVDVPEAVTYSVANPSIWTKFVTDSLARQFSISRSSLANVKVLFTDQKQKIVTGFEVRSESAIAKLLKTQTAHRENGQAKPYAGWWYTFPINNELWQTQVTMESVEMVETIAPPKATKRPTPHHHHGMSAEEIALALVLLFILIILMIASCKIIYSRPKQVTCTTKVKNTAVIYSNDKWETDSTTSLV